MPEPLKIDGRTIICSGKRLKTAQIFDEAWLPNSFPEHLERFVEKLRESRLPADIFQATQQFPDTTIRWPSIDYEPYSNAATETKSFDHWWKKLPQESRKNTRRAERRGIIVKPVTFNENLVTGIKEIYDETPIRQGRRFWHYGKEIDTIKRENGTYLSNSRFLGAYEDKTLVGFVKLVYVENTARVMQILSRLSHYEKFVMNALISASVQQCASDGLSHLIYGQYIYGKKTSSSITEFKRRNGFIDIQTPRYIIPLNTWGSAAIKIGLHKPFSERIPDRLITFLLDIRSRYHNLNACKEIKPV